MLLQKYASWKAYTMTNFKMYIFGSPFFSTLWQFLILQMKSKEGKVQQIINFMYPFT